MVVDWVAADATTPRRAKAAVAVRTSAMVVPP
jgi:hypothetical protein